MREKRNKSEDKDEYDGEGKRKYSHTTGMRLFLFENVKNNSSVFYLG